MNPQLDRTLNRWLEGDLTASEGEALQELLAADPEARRAYYDLLLIDHMLSERAEGRALPPAPARPLAEPTPPRRWRVIGATLAAAAAVVIGCGIWFHERAATPPASASFPRIEGSADSRITIAQREDRSHWEPGELLRVDRGSAKVAINRTVSAHFGGPAAIELLDERGNLFMLEGQASFVTETGGGGFTVHAPGGVVQTLGTRFEMVVRPDGSANVDARAGDVEVMPRGGEKPILLKEGNLLRLSIFGSWSIEPTQPSAGVGQPLATPLFHERFQAPDGTPLNGRSPETGAPWKVFEELYPTLLKHQRLDTSGGARRLMATLPAHGLPDSHAVYVFSFQLVPPEGIDDKVLRQDGFESISLVDAAGAQLLALQATAVDGHRWQLVAPAGAASPLTPVCALWPHSVTLCYGMDGGITLHDGASPQAPVIASLKLAPSRAVAGILLTNRTGGDFAFTGIDATLVTDTGPAKK